jgi:hypothetical protein
MTKQAKDGPNDPMKEMRERYKRAVDADGANRELARADQKFVTIPGNAWDEKQKKARGNRPCYEFPILRSHARQVINDQKKARPGIKVRAVEDGDVEGAELRQGIIRNIESVSNAERAYDAGFELLVYTGMGAWQVVTEYSTDDGWDQDIRVRPIKDALSSVWLDPDDFQNPKWGFVEETMSREAFEAKYPDADAVSFEGSQQYGDWFGKDSVRVAAYWRQVPVTKTLVLLSDGRTVDAAELDEAAIAQLAQEGVTPGRTRQCKGHKIVSSIVSGKEEIEGPVDSVFSRIPIVVCHANLHYIDGQWTWAGMVRFSRDPQKLLNYNLTTAQEVLAKQHKATPIVTAKMLEGKGVKQMWDTSNATDAPYLPITADPQMPDGPKYLQPPPIHQAFSHMAQIATDMLKASDGIFDASVGARSNETSGRAINARREEGDTATFDYQDALNFGIQTTGELILSALPKVYDTPRVMRVIGKDGAEDWKRLYEEVQDPQTGQAKVINDLSAGKYDVTVTTGANYDTQRMEFVETLAQISQANPAIAPFVADLMVGSMDFPKADEAAERLKLLLPPQVQQAMAQKDQSPAVMQLQAQMQQMQQMAQMQMQEMAQELQKAQAKASQVEDKQLQAQVEAAKVHADRERIQIEWFKAETDRLKVQADAAHKATQQAIDGQLTAAEMHMKDAHKAVDVQQADAHKHADLSHQAQSAEAEREFQAQASKTSGDSAA